jgi:hypothetical protein
MTKRKFHKRVIKVTVLSEDELNPNLDLDNIHTFIVHGDGSGQVEWGPDRKINGREAVKELKRQGSDPEFFMLDDNGEDLE